MPAAAVIPAPVAYIKIVAVRKLVVGFLLLLVRGSALVLLVCGFCRTTFTPMSRSNTWDGHITLRKLECFKRAFALNTTAWNKTNELSSFWWVPDQVMIDRDGWGC